MRRPVPSLASPPGVYAVDAFTAALTGIRAAAASAGRGVTVLRGSVTFANMNFGLRGAVFRSRAPLA